MESRLHSDCWLQALSAYFIIQFSSLHNTDWSFINRNCVSCVRTSKIKYWKPAAAKYPKSVCFCQCWRYWIEKGMAESIISVSFYIKNILYLLYSQQISRTSKRLEINIWCYLQVSQTPLRAAVRGSWCRYSQEKIHLGIFLIFSFVHSVFYFRIIRWA